ncbi:hypothetical protein GCM10027168_25440 [Streptomyces capparidis]
MADLGVPEDYVTGQGLGVTERGQVLGTATRADGSTDAHPRTVR